MDIITSMFTIVNNVGDADREYKILSKKLEYCTRKADHFLQQKKLDNIPSFILQNFKHKNSQAKQYLEKIQSLLTSKSMPLKQKIKLSLPFNKTSDNVKTVIEELQKALQDISQYTTTTASDLQQKQVNAKRPVKIQSNSESDRERDEQNQIKKKKVSISNQEIDQGLQQQLMGPTIQEDQAIQFTKNKYVTLNVQLMGKAQIIELIKGIYPDILTFNKKQLIKFQNQVKKQDQNYLKLFSLTRLYFKPVYGKLKAIYPDVDRISKNDHFIVYLKRSREQLKQQDQKRQKQVQEKQLSQKVQNQQFFSFPDEPVAVKEKFQIQIQRAVDKSLYFLDMSGLWQKVQQTKKVLVNGDRIATFLPAQNKNEEPGLYFKIKFTLTE